MELLLFGHGGARVLVFPTSMGRFFEWDDRGMVGALAEHIDRGWIQLCCVDSVDSESWYARWKYPGDRALRAMASTSATSSRRCCRSRTIGTTTPS
jgi:esterase/lipase superfamily enzyme